MYSTSALVSGFSSLDDGGRCVLPPLHTVILLPLRTASVITEKREKGQQGVFSALLLPATPSRRPSFAPLITAEQAKLLIITVAPFFWVGAVGSCSCPAKIAREL